MSVECKIIKNYGVVANHNGITLELKKVAWGSNAPCYDLRAWNKNFALKGMTLSADDLRNLNKIIKELDLNVEVKEEPVVEKPKAKRGRPKKEQPVKKVETKKTEYTNAYDKFVDMFAEYRKSQPESRQKGFELTHKIITDHIKDIIETSDEYNTNAMQPWKNSHQMMLFIQDKAFENAECLMNVATMEESNQYLCMWVDEYIGMTTDKPKEKKNA